MQKKEDRKVELVFMNFRGYAFFFDDDEENKNKEICFQDALGGKTRLTAESSTACEAVLATEKRK